MTSEGGNRNRVGRSTPLVQSSRNLKLRMPARVEKAVRSAIHWAGCLVALVAARCSMGTLITGLAGAAILRYEGCFRAGAWKHL